MITSYKIGVRSHIYYCVTTIVFITRIWLHLPVAYMKKQHIFYLNN